MASATPASSATTTDRASAGPVLVPATSLPATHATSSSNNSSAASAKVLQELMRHVEQQRADHEAQLLELRSESATACAALQRQLQTSEAARLRLDDELRATTRQLQSREEDVERLRRNLELQARATEELEVRSRSHVEEQRRRVLMYEKELSVQSSTFANYERRIAEADADRDKLRKDVIQRDDEIRRLRRDLQVAEADLNEWERQRHRGLLVTRTIHDEALERLRLLSADNAALLASNSRLLSIMAYAPTDGVGGLSRYVEQGHLGEGFVFCGSPAMTEGVARGYRGGDEFDDRDSDSSSTGDHNDNCGRSGRLPAATQRQHAGRAGQRRQIGLAQLSDLRTEIGLQNSRIQHAQMLMLRHRPDGPPSFSWVAADPPLIDRDREKEFWIPRGAYELGASFHAAVVPKISAEAFYLFFVALNKVWHSHFDMKRRAIQRMSEEKAAAAAQNGAVGGAVGFPRRSRSRPSANGRGGASRRGGGGGSYQQSGSSAYDDMSADAQRSAQSAPPKASRCVVEEAEKRLQSVAVLLSSRLECPSVLKEAVDRLMKLNRDAIGALRREMEIGVRLQHQMEDTVTYRGAVSRLEHVAVEALRSLEGLRHRVSHHVDAQHVYHHQFKLALEVMRSKLSAVGLQDLCEVCAEYRDVMQAGQGHIGDCFREAANHAESLQSAIDGLHVAMM